MTVLRSATKSRVSPSDAEGVQQRAALGRCPVSRKPLAVRLEAGEQRQKRTAEILYPAGELRIRGPIDQPMLLLVAKQRLNR